MERERLARNCSRVKDANASHYCGLGCSGSALPTIATETVALLLDAHHRILSCMFHLRSIATKMVALLALPRASSDCTQHFPQIADWEYEELFTYPKTVMDFSKSGWRSRGYLPHLEAGQLTQFITLRLYDSLPAAALAHLMAKLTEIPEAQRSAYTRARIHKWLDSGYGSCMLRHHDVAVAAQPRKGGNAVLARA